MVIFQRFQSVDFRIVCEVLLVLRRAEKRDAFLTRSEHVQYALLLENLSRCPVVAVEPAELLHSQQRELFIEELELLIKHQRTVARLTPSQLGQSKGLSKQ